jgi:hypothetical protein
MPYRIAGIDVHKKMLAVVVADVEIDGDFHFDRLRTCFCLVFGQKLFTDCSRSASLTRRALMSSAASGSPGAFEIHPGTEPTTGSPCALAARPSAPSWVAMTISTRDISFQRSAVAK